MFINTAQKSPAVSLAAKAMTESISIYSNKMGLINLLGEKLGTLVFNRPSLMEQATAIKGLLLKVITLSQENNRLKKEIAEKEVALEEKEVALEEKEVTLEEKEKELAEAFGEGFPV